MTDLVGYLQDWRDRDQADSTILSRNEIITLLEEIYRLRRLKISGFAGGEVNKLNSQLAAASRQIMRLQARIRKLEKGR